MPFSISSKTRLTDRDLERFPGDTLFDRAARAVCRAGCLPRKELYEAWEMARRVRRRDRSFAVDVMRAVRLELRGYRAWTQTIPATITPKNRLLLGQPRLRVVA